MPKAKHKYAVGDRVKVNTHRLWPNVPIGTEFDVLSIGYRKSEYGYGPFYYRGEGVEFGVWEEYLNPVEPACESVRTDE